MQLVFHPHAEREIEKRQIPRQVLLEVLHNPEQKVPGYKKRWIYQRRYFNTIHSKELLLRVVVEERREVLLVLSVYKTSKIRRYWQREA